MLPRVIPRLFGYAHSSNIDSLYWRIGLTSPFSLAVSYFWVLREGNIKNYAPLGLRRMGWTPDMVEFDET